MTNHNKYVFKHVDHLVEHLFQNFEKISYIDLQNGLYFLYAYYVPFYNTYKDKIPNLAPELFDAEFKTSLYGVTIEHVRNKQFNNKYKVKETNYYNSNNRVIIDVIDNRIMFHINDLFTQIQETNDFDIVDRIHEDKEWLKTYHSKESNILNNKEILKEYTEKSV